MHPEHQELQPYLTNTTGYLQYKIRIKTLISSCSLQLPMDILSAYTSE